MIRWLRRAGAMLVGLAVVIWGVGAILPSDWMAEETMEIDASPTAVERELAALEHWSHWAVWNRRHLKDLKVETSGRRGALWEAEALGRVHIEPVVSDGARGGDASEDAGRFRYRMTFDETESAIEGTFRWEPAEGGERTRLTWTQRGTLPPGAIARWTGLTLVRVFARADMRESLAALKERLER